MIHTLDRLQAVHAFYKFHFVSSAQLRFRWTPGAGWGKRTGVRRFFAAGDGKDSIVDESCQTD